MEDARHDLKNHKRECCSSEQAVACSTRARCKGKRSLRRECAGSAGADGREPWQACSRSVRCSACSGGPGLGASSS
eukprot:15450220-Alexandrium_andersonii.AAC.1